MTDAPKSRFPASDRDRSRFPSQALRNLFVLTKFRNHATLLHTSSHRFSRSCSIFALELPRFFPFQVTRGASRSFAPARELKNPHAHDFSTAIITVSSSQRRFFLRLSTRVSPLTHARRYQQVIPHKRETVNAPYDPRCRVAVSRAAQRYAPPHGVVIVA